MSLLIFRSCYRDLKNVAWNDSHLETEEKRIYQRENFINDRREKLGNLQSDGNVYGNTKGIG